jgi:CubicO group peptidase (beta-lactamase class C family)
MNKRSSQEPTPRHRSRHDEAASSGLHLEVDLGASTPALRSSIGHLLSQPPELQLTLAVLVVQDGRIVAEGYGPACGVDHTLISWSMAKSITHALFGLLLSDGLVGLEDRAPVVQWQGDDRSAITVQQLLNMRSGLEFVEDYVDEHMSDCIKMLFGGGASDVAAYAASKPLVHEPGTFWSYSSGTTNILCRIAGDLIGGGAAGMQDYLQKRLFDPLGMRSAVARFDAAGTFIGSSFVYATARDFARFGLLYLHDGMVDGDRILPEGWVEHARRPVPVPETETYGYGAHWWLAPEFNAFACHGHEGQRIVVVPDHNAVVVRLGKTTAEHGDALNAAMHDLLRSL